ncbi:MAG: hypothetical protein ACK5VI_10860 [Opitutia bacterium]|jgi:hypothetical protein
MAINASKITQDNPVALQRFVYRGSPAISQTNAAFARFEPGFRGEIVAVRANARTVNGFSVPEVRIVASAADTGTNVLQSALTPTAIASASPAEGTLVAARASRRFTATQEILLHLTTGGTAPVEPCVEIVVRPFPLNGEAE